MNSLFRTNLCRLKFVFHSFKKNMTAAVERCSEHHKNATLPYYQCLCSGLTSDSFAYTRYKYYFCKRAADLEKKRE
ncbi:hypothetical protein FJT64_003593 [Amphibalanus amphitrite]|uniref:Uncharacterized protein n=1 Tax=Amphibalanus amphitrite TaxID=1232801 RepID=A0A6A4VZT1_AMPAM|nr:hypothetical protein FJT64_003593 [Amphibalanus amphitrite]